MICPHCEKDLLRKERPDNTCSKCNRRYALDPKTNPLRLNDLRVRRVLAKLTDEGRLPCAPGQLWYALSRNSLRHRHVDAGCFAFLFVIGGGIILGGPIVGSRLMFIVGGIVVGFGVLLAIASVTGNNLGKPQLPRHTFHQDVLAAWAKVYGGLPPGVVDDRQYPSPQPARAGALSATLLCPDPSVAAFLTAEGLPERYGLLLARDVADVLAHGPVVVLHDVGPRGLLLPQHARAALPGREVIDAGLPLRAVRGLPNAVPVRERKPDRAVLAELTASGHYTEEELTWLRKGWTYPLVAVPPARLLTVVDRVAERVSRRADPQRRRAAAVGFMTWPAEGER